MEKQDELIYKHSLFNICNISTICIAKKEYITARNIHVLFYEKGYKMDEGLLGKRNVK